MDIYKLKLTRLQNGIFRLLCIKAGSALNQREIARLLKVSPTAVSKALKGLESGKLVVMRRSKTINLSSVEINRDEPVTVGIKRAENLKMVYESGLAGYLEEKFPACAVILFGSYSYGEDTLESDIDIAVIGSRGKEINTEKYEKMLERKIFLHFYEKLGEMNKNLKSNILNGIILSGQVEI